jgi:hypothetical protein
MSFIFVMICLVSTISALTLAKTYLEDEVDVKFSKNVAEF